MTRIAIVSMVKAPLHELRIFVHYHLNIGIDDIILMFDDPLDPGLEDFLQFPSVTSIVCSDEYWIRKTGRRSDVFSDRQRAAINEGVKTATEKGCNWVIQLDSDELLKPLSDIRDVLQNCDADVLRFPVLEAVSEKKNYDSIFSATLFKTESGTAKIKVAKLLGCSKIIYRNEYYRGHTDSKVAVRLSSDIQVHGVHGPKEYNRKVIRFENTDKVLLLHFDCVGFDSWNRKWSGRHSGTGLSFTMRINRQQQLQAYVLAKEAGDLALAKLYRRLHIIGSYEKGVLFLLGMLTRTRSQQSLFSHVENTTDSTGVDPVKSA